MPELIFEIYTGFYPTQLAAEKQAALVQSLNGNVLYEYLIEKTVDGDYRLKVFREVPLPVTSTAPEAAGGIKPKSGPTLRYNLELDAEELSALHQLLQENSCGFSPTEDSIQEKVIRLMEGR